MERRNVKAMIMAAGVGSRLEPLTKYVPKPLVPIVNKPVMDILLQKLSAIGVKDVIANTYYQSEQIINRYKNNNFGINFNYITEETLSGTAGGLKKCQHFFSENDEIIVLSADGLSNADLEKGIEIHKKSEAIATIGIKEVPKTEVPHFGVVVTDKNGYITEFQEKPSIEDAKSTCINTGIYIFSYKIFDYIPEDTFYDFAKNVFPILLDINQINTFEISEYWSDIGTLDQYKLSTQEVFEGLCSIDHSGIIKTSTGLYISGDSKIPESTKFIGNSVVGNNCIIAENVSIENCIIWDDVRIDEGLTLSDCIIASNCHIMSSLRSQITEANQLINQ